LLFGKYFHNYSLPPLPVEGPQNLSTILPQFFQNSSTILPRVEEFGASGLAWRRMVEGIIVEKFGEFRPCPLCHHKNALISQ
jgi:hypothetical protein